MTEKKDISQNLNVGLEIAKEEYESVLVRFREMDSKFNTLLVFVAGEIAAFGAIFSIISPNVAFRIAFAIVFFSFLLVAIIVNFIGLFTKGLELIETKEMLKESLYEKDNNKFMAIFIATYHKCIVSIEKRIRRKCLLFNISLIFVILSFIIFCTFIVIYFFL